MQFVNLVADQRMEGFSWNHQGLLGSGAFGQVYFGKQDSTGKYVAIKEMKLKELQDPYMQQALKNEVNIMKSLNCPNVVNFIDVFETSNHIYIILEFCNGGDFRSILTKRGSLPEAEAIRIFKDILNGFKVLVSQNIIHRDMKPENILIHDGIYKLADFGLSRTVSNYNDEMLKTACGTPLYMSPQILKNENYTTKSDIWSLGVIYYEMVYGDTPWPAKSQYDLITKMCSQLVKFPIITRVSGSSKHFIKTCLAVEERDRATWDQIFADITFFAEDLSARPFQDGNNKNLPLSNNEAKFDGLFDNVLKKIQEGIQSNRMTHKEFFGKFDRQYRDKLSENDFKKLIRSVYPMASYQECLDIFKEIDFDGNGYICLQEFLDYVMEADYDGPKENPLLNQQRADRIIHNLKDHIYAANIPVHQIFSKFKGYSSSELSEAELYQILQRIDATVTQAEANFIFKKFDTNRDGRISILEFEAIVSPPKEPGLRNVSVVLENFHNSPNHGFSPSGGKGYEGLPRNPVQPKYEGMPEQRGFGQPAYGNYGGNQKFDVNSVINEMRKNLRNSNVSASSLFLIYNSSHSGMMTLREFNNLVTSLDLNYSESDLSATFNHIDRNRDNKVDINDFEASLM